MPATLTLAQLSDGTIVAAEQKDRTVILFGHDNGEFRVVVRTPDAVACGDPFWSYAAAKHEFENVVASGCSN